MPLSWNEIRHRAIASSKEWRGGMREAAERQSFWNDFFKAEAHTAANWLRKEGRRGWRHESLDFAARRRGGRRSISGRLPRETERGDSRCYGDTKR
jgi:hypothetical protein